MVGTISGPKTLEPYTILEDPREAPFGRVMRGLDPDGETAVLIVQVDPSRLPVGERKALVAEARALTRLVKPGLPLVYEVREGPDGLHVVFRPPPGPPAGPASAALHVHDREGLARDGIRLLLLLAEAHAGGILHRHLGERSVQLAATGSLALIGFGLTRLVDDPTWEPPPEVARGSAATLAGDLYAVGRLLLRWAERAGPAVLGSPVEDPLAAVLARATADDPAGRYEDAADMARALALAAKLPRTPGRDPEETQRLERPRPPARHEPPPEGRAGRARGLTLALVLAAVVCGGVLAAGGFWSGDSEIPRSERGPQTAPPPPPPPVLDTLEPEPAAAESDPRSAAQLERARALVEAGRVAEAVPILEELLAGGELPNPVPVLDLLGTLRLQTGKPAEAARLLGRATALQPDSDLLYKLGLALAAAGRPAEAAEQLRAARELAPESTEIREALGHLEEAP